MVYNEMKLNAGYRIDSVVEKSIIIEFKSAV
ncbi:MAG: hypothetical protein C0598_08405 [Marinilabiliales bacterium]|nr:MAG: hypothetical protein C0598_08405 [Marinilabiliales bacterium]